MKKILAALTAALLLVSLAACGGRSGMSEEEMRETFRTLVEASYELNDIYYGVGLPFVHDEDAMAFLAGVAADTDGYKFSYMPVAEDASYKTEADIRAATSAVFSPDLCSHLFVLGFEGLSTENDERVAFARYIEQNGTLTVRIDLAEEALKLGRTYDFSTMKVQLEEKDRVRAQFASLVDGVPSQNVRITIIKTADGWRLDSPTY